MEAMTMGDLIVAAIKAAGRGDVAEVDRLARLGEQAFQDHDTCELDDTAIVFPDRMPQA